MDTEKKCCDACKKGLKTDLKCQEIKMIARNLKIKDNSPDKKKLMLKLKIKL